MYFHSLLDLCRSHENVRRQFCWFHKKDERPRKQNCCRKAEAAQPRKSRNLNQPQKQETAQPVPATPSQDQPNLSHPSTVAIKSYLPPKFYSCLWYGIIIVAINNKTHTDIDPLAMAVWSFMLRKIHIQAK